MKIKINKSFTQKIKATPETKKVINSFGLNLDNEHKIIDNLELILNKPFVLYIYGYSGSGKTTILKEIENYFKKNKINFYSIYDWRQVEIDKKKVLVEFFSDIFDYNQRLYYLSKFGLGEAWKYISTYNILSDGEKFRFILYYFFMMLKKEKNKFLIIDEFCATLDRLTAKTISQNINKLAKKEKVNLILASTHNDIISYLNPKYLLFKEYDPKTKLEEFSENIFDINIELFKKVKEKNRCLCDLKKECPCEIFLEKGQCKCGVFKKI